MVGMGSASISSSTTNEGTKGMNIKQVNESLNPLGLRCSRKDGEYRVAFMYGWHGVVDVEASAYYTDSLEDAESTGIAMYNQAKVA